MPTTQPHDISSPTVAIIVMGFICVTAIAATAVVGRAAFASSRKGATKSFGLLFERAVRFATVCLIVLAVTVLAMLGSLTDGAIGVLSGVAGFVLGSATTSRATTPSRNTRGTPQAAPGNE